MALLPLVLVALSAAGRDDQDGDLLDLLPHFLLHFVRRFIVVGSRGQSRFLNVVVPRSSSSTWSEVARQRAVLLLHRDIFLPVVLFGHEPDHDTAFRIRRRQPSGGLILLGTAQEVESSIRHLRERPEWSPRVRILVLLLPSDQDAPQQAGKEVLPLLSSLWSMSATSVVIAVPRVTGDPSVSLYTMAPFRDNSSLCGQGAMAVDLLGTVPLRDVQSGLQGLALYQDVVPRDLRGCSVRGSVFAGASDARCRGAEDGEDSDHVTTETYVLRGMLEAAAHNYNFKAVVKVDGITTGASEMFAGKFTGRLGILERGETDVAMAPFTYTAARLQRLRPSVPFLLDPAQVRVRCSLQDKPAASVLVNELSRSGLLPMLAVAATATVTCQLLVRCIANRGGSAAETMHLLARSLLDVWSMLCEVATPLSTPFAARLPARLLVASWLLFVLNLNVAFKGLLSAASTVTAPPVRRVTSIDQLRSSGLVVGYPSVTYKELVLGELLLPEERTLVCTNNSDTDYCEQRFNSDENFAVLRTSKMPVAMRCLTSCHYTLDAVVKTTPLVFYTRKDFPLAGVLDRSVLSLQSAGIIEHWLSRGRLLERVGKDDRQSKPRFLQEALFCLAVGLPASLAVFLVEWIRYGVLSRTPLLTFSSWAARSVQSLQSGGNSEGHITTGL